VNHYERILNACSGDEEQAELIAQQIARVTTPYPARQVSGSDLPRGGHAALPRISPSGLEAALMEAICAVLEDWR